MSQELRFSIEGMHCGACVRRVTAALGNVAGVQVESVEIGSATVKTQDEALQASQIIAAVDRIGFSATLNS